MDKQTRHEAIRERARAALRDMYHNATVNYPRLDDADAQRFEGWFEGARESELDYLQSGGAYGDNYRKTLAAPCNAGKYASVAARQFYITNGMRKMREERNDCGILTGWRVIELAAGNKNAAKIMAGYPGAKRNNSLWERITEYGTLYQYGRGGRTLAPDGLMTRRESGPNEDYADGLNIASCVLLIRILESFNRYVGAWCESVPEQWAECEAERIAEERREEYARRARKAKETRERNLWACRGLVTT